LFKFEINKLSKYSEYYKFKLNKLIVFTYANFSLFDIILRYKIKLSFMNPK